MTHFLQVGIRSGLEMLRGILEKDASLARYTSWKVGGVADILYRPADLQDVRNFLTTLDAKVPVIWLGGGTNVLVRDGGIRGAVVLLHGCLDQLDCVDTGLVRAEAGVSCAKLARLCANLELQGAEFFSGIPGSVGGALAMNSGAHGSETWEFVQSVETVDRSGSLHVRYPKEFSPGYRTVCMPGKEWFTGALFRFTSGNSEMTKDRIRELLEMRNAAQPVGSRSCGSVFRNPENDYAARLIEMCNLKGVSNGGACVSEKHANFIVNEGDATAKDIEDLIWKVHETVKNKCGTVLVPEVRIIGETA